MLGTPTFPDRVIEPMYMLLPVNPLPTNDAYVVSWTHHEPIDIYMGLTLGVVLQGMVSAYFSWGFTCIILSTMVSASLSYFV